MQSEDSSLLLMGRSRGGSSLWTPLGRLLGGWRASSTRGYQPCVEAAVVVEILDQEEEIDTEASDLAPEGPSLGVPTATSTSASHLNPSSPAAPQSSAGAADAAVAAATAEAATAEPVGPAAAAAAEAAGTLALPVAGRPAEAGAGTPAVASAAVEAAPTPTAEAVAGLQPSTSGDAPVAESDALLPGSPAAAPSAWTSALFSPFARMAASLSSSRPPAPPSSSSGAMGDGSSKGLEPPPMASGSAAALPMCLVCLDSLPPEQFESGEAIQQDCRCKGDAALRHKACAVKWSQVKGSTVCDVCQSPILNLPPLAVAPRDAEALEMMEELQEEHSALLLQHTAMADRMFDAIRVTWMSSCAFILFFRFPVGLSLLIGSLVGLTYSMLTRMQHAQQRGRDEEAGEFAVYV